MACVAVLVHTSRPVQHVGQLQVAGVPLRRIKIKAQPCVRPEVWKGIHTQLQGMNDGATLFIESHSFKAEVDMKRHTCMSSAHWRLPYRIAVCSGVLLAKSSIL